MSERALAVAELERVCRKDKFLFRDLGLVEAAVIIEEINRDLAFDFHRLALVVIKENSPAKATFAGLASFRFYCVCPDSHDFVGRLVGLVPIPGEGCLDVERLASADGKGQQAEGERDSPEKQKSVHWMSNGRHGSGALAKELIGRTHRANWLNSSHLVLPLDGHGSCRQRWWLFVGLSASRGLPRAFKEAIGFRGRSRLALRRDFW